MKTLTHIEAVRLQQRTAAGQVQYYLGWTHQQYCDHQYEQYEAFIGRMCDGLPAIAQRLRYSPVFRGFWNNEWAHRNERDFLPTAIELTEGDYEISTNGCLIIQPGLHTGEAYLIDEYLYIHNHMRLISNRNFLTHYEATFNLIFK